MLISQYADLRENKTGFWVEKLYSQSGKCSFLVHHQGMTEFKDTISECKTNLCDRYKKILETRNQLIADSARRSLLEDGAFRELYYQKKTILKR